jgi:curved DNA-binding protein CbpA
MQPFVDYYELMQISQNAETHTVQRVYRMLAARYHPDNPETGDTDRFLLLQRAYEVLSDSRLRCAYNAELERESARALPVFEMKDFVVGVDVEMNRRLGVLSLVYNRRKADPDRPGLSLLDLETRMALPREHLEFTVWYLREKGMVRRDETNNDILITSEGVDFVESSVPSNRLVRRLLKASQDQDLLHPAGATLGDASGHDHARFKLCEQ